MLPTFTILVSSPSDLNPEREIARLAIERLKRNYAKYLDIKPILWEWSELSADDSFQEKLNPANYDVMISMLWTRLGTPLSPRYLRDGQASITGTEWELEQAYAANGKSEEAPKRPGIEVYIKSAPLVFNDKYVKEESEEFANLRGFINRFFEGGKGDSQSEKRPYKSFMDEAHFEKLLEAYLEGVVRDQIKNSARSGDTWLKGSPFLGLKAFSEAHEDIFFGRENATLNILSTFEKRIEKGLGFLLITGSSGSGKSSLLHAGVLPLFTVSSFYNKIKPVIILLKECWSTLPENPLYELAKLIEKYEEDGNFESNLHDTLCQAATTSELKRHLQRNYLIVLDQAEEIYTSYSSNDDKTEFWEGVQRLIQSKKVCFLGTMRSDFVSRIDSGALIDLMQGDGDYKLQAPKQHEIINIIRKPALAAGLRFELDKNKVSLDDRIIEDSLSLVEMSNGMVTTLVLPFIEFCLSELYRECIRDEGKDNLLTYAAYDSLGGIKGAITNRAESVYQGFENSNKEHKDIERGFHRVLSKLIQVNGDDKPSTALEVNRETFPSNSLERKIIDHFVEERLFTASQDSIRLVHEVLITEWERVSKWLDENSAFLRDRDQLEKKATQWEQQGKAYEDLLNKPTDLSSAKEILKTRKEDLTPLIVNFIRASETRSDDLIARDKFEQTKKIGIGIVAIIVLLLLLIFAVSQSFSATEARKNMKIEKEAADKARELAELREKEAAIQRDKAQTTETLFLTDLAKQNLTEGETDTALLLTLNALPGVYGGQRKINPNALEQMTIAAQSQRKKHVLQRGGIVFSANYHGNENIIVHMPGKTVYWNIAELEPVTGNIRSTVFPKAVFSPTEEAVLVYQDPVVLKPLNESGEMLYFNTGEIGELAIFRPDGLQLATVPKPYQQVDIFSAIDGDKFLQINFGDYINDIAFTPDGTTLIARMENGNLRYAFISEKSVIHETACSMCIGHPVVVSPNGKKVVALNEDRNVVVHTLYSDDTSVELGQLELKPIAYTFVANNRLAVSYEGAKIVLWNTETGISEWQQSFRTNTTRITFNPRGDKLLVVQNNQVKLLSVHDGKEITTYAHNSPIKSAEFNQTASNVVLSDENGEVAIWAVTDPVKERLTFQHKGQVREAILSANTKQILLWEPQKERLSFVDTETNRRVKTISDILAVSCDKNCLVQQENKHFLVWVKTDGTLALQSLEEPFESRQLNLGEVKKVASASFAASGNLLLVQEENNNIAIWKVSDGSEHRLYLSKEALYEPTFSHDGHTWAAKDALQRLLLFTIDSSEIRQLDLQIENVHVFQFTTDGQYLAFSTKNKTSYIDIKSQAIYDLPESANVIEIIAGDDSDRLLTVSKDNTVTLWELSSRTKVSENRISADVTHIEFSSNNSHYLIASVANKVSLWSASTGTLIGELASSDITGATFSSSGETILTKSKQHKVEQWSAHTLNKLSEYPHYSAVDRFSFDSNEEHIVVVTEEGKALLWQIAPALSIDEAIKTLPVNRQCLSPQERKQYFLADLTDEQWQERGCKQFVTTQ